MSLSFFIFTCTHITIHTCSFPHVWRAWNTTPTFWPTPWVVEEHQLSPPHHGWPGVRPDTGFSVVDMLVLDKPSRLSVVVHSQAPRMQLMCPPKLYLLLVLVWAVGTLITMSWVKLVLVLSWVDSEYNGPQRIQLKNWVILFMSLSRNLSSTLFGSGNHFHGVYSEVLQKATGTDTCVDRQINIPGSFWTLNRCQTRGCT